jgi:hypothetical protein
MLRQIKQSEEGYIVLLCTPVGVYSAPGLDVKRAVDQFSAAARNNAIAGLRLTALLYAQGDKQHTLRSHAGFDQIEYARKDIASSFEIAANERKRTLDVLGRNDHQSAVVPAPVEQFFKHLKPEEKSNFEEKNYGVE